MIISNLSRFPSFIGRLFVARRDVPASHLAKDLGVPVVPTIARQGEGMPELLKNIHAVATGDYVCKPHRSRNMNATLASAIDRLASQIDERFPGLPNARWLALRPI